MAPSERRRAGGKRAALVTGGGGFVGRRLTCELLESGEYDEVHLLDVRPPREDAFTPGQRARLRCFAGSITDAELVASAARGCSAAFHLAAVGMSGSEQLRTKFVEEINVKGTETVIQACLSCGVQRLIYCSTYNVVFAGTTIVDGDEDKTPYVPRSKHVDAYSRTKAEAEQKVLAANGTRGGACAEAGASGGGPVLWTVAVRPAGIYGDGEERHLPRILRLLRAGLGFFSVGAKELLVDWVYVENFTHALRLADRALMSGGDSQRGGAGGGPSGSGEPRGDPAGPAPPVAAGQAYCISDGAPANNFTFLARLFEPLGYRNLFALRVPTGIMYGLACATEAVFFSLAALGIYVDIPGCLLTRAEVCKVGYTHTFSMAKARRELGYVPPVSVDEAVRRCADYLRAEGFAIDGPQRTAKVARAAAGGKLKHRPPLAPKGAAWPVMLVAAALVALAAALLMTWARWDAGVEGAVAGEPGGGRGLRLLRSGVELMRETARAVHATSRHLAWSPGDARGGQRGGAGRNA